MHKSFVAAISVVALAVAMTSWVVGARMHATDAAVYAADVKAPELIGKPSAWINTGGQALKLYGAGGILAQDPLAPAKRPVVVIDFWEYTCVNCIRTLPYIEDWSTRYRDSGLVVIGIHTPEFTFAHEEANVAAAVKRFGITYPVVVDGSFDNWNAYNNDEWPMKYVLDDTGKIVFTHPGEGGYGETEQRLRDMLERANPGEVLPPAYGDHETDIISDEPVTDMTAELYAGSDRGRLQNPEGYGGGAVIDYSPIPLARWVDGKVVARGQWRFTNEYAEHARVNLQDSIGVAYHADTAVAVIKPGTTTPFKVYVTQDGAWVDPQDAGPDLHFESSGRSYLLIDAPREYQVIHNREFGRHALTLFPGTDQFRLYSFDFEAT
jgi:thiol-disulfide isomerase/thioredoxin